MPICPVCSGSFFTRVADAEQVEEECRIRERFVQERLTRPAVPSELKDLTDFFHAERADILECGGCTLLLRDEHEPPPAQEYSEDAYDPSVMDHLFPRYVDAFRRKERPYRDLLPQGSRVLEVGSHYGAFLQTAQEWGWQAEGVDVGKDTSRFTTSKGFAVHTVALEESPLSESTFDGVFIWNCFEQIEDPKPTLRACRRILKPHGLLVVRTPNGLFYSMCQKLLRDPGLHGGAKEFLLDAMGYNNILGFPYLYGHNRATLERLIEPYGFRFSAILNSELLTLPLPQNPVWVEQEERAINSKMRLLSNSIIADTAGTFTGSWVEARFEAA